MPPTGYVDIHNNTVHGRDSLELGSLASSNHSNSRLSGSSSPSGPPSSRRLSLDNEDPLHLPTPGSSRPNHDRSYSISSAFDFAPPIFTPLTSNGYAALGESSSAPSNHTVEAGSLERHKSLTFLNGLSLVIGVIIGSGIFSSPSQVNVNAGSPGASLIVWMVAGILAWTGAASFAELGGAIPLNGGAQVYLAKIYGDAAGFLYSWSTVCVLKPGSAAIVAIIFGEYVVRAVVGPNARSVSPLFNKGAALIGLALVTILNSVSTKIAARTADILMFFKFLALLAVTVIGIVVAVTGWSWNGEPSNDWKTVGWFEGTSSDLSNFAVALYAGLWAYDGWDNTNYVTGEFINPTRDLPRVIHTSLPLVIVSYLLANTAYFLVLPLSVTSSSTTIAVDFGAQVLGRIGSLLLALTVAGSSFGALNASAFTSGRLFYAAGKEGYLPAFFGNLGFGGKTITRLHNQPGAHQQQNAFTRTLVKLCSSDQETALFVTPIPALGLNFLLTGVYVVLGTFRTLLLFAGVANYLFYFITVLGLVVLRVKEPHLERPYRCWITTPIIFCCVSLFLLSRTVVAEPLISLAVIVFIVVGLGVHFLRMSRLANKMQAEGDDVGWRFWKRWRK